MAYPYSHLHLPYPRTGEPAPKDPQPGTAAAVIEDARIGRMQTKLGFWARQAELAREVEEERRKKEAEGGKGEGEGGGGGCGGGEDGEGGGS